MRANVISLTTDNGHTKRLYTTNAFYGGRTTIQAYTKRLERSAISCVS